MRNDFTPVETREIPEADLDSVSGGVLGDMVQDGTSALPGLPGLPVLPGLPGGAISGGGIQVTGPVSGQASFSGIAGL
ncbi:type A2 lantipeptide [Streptomyces sp. A1-5]|uniref:type A2 lantipeptide n=1 Tax=Streptomyces sp. A1-5 TaxID=2738410 RepID=UPI001F22E09E|nr:type A2 lantipeptide [Streptomyces sp. A1-5]UJB40541.1 type A2 lantipeptide [Streptomyces sp. A1-5]